MKLKTALSESKKQENNLIFNWTKEPYFDLKPMRMKGKHIKTIISLALHINMTDLGTRNMILNNKNFNSKSQSATSNRNKTIFMK